MILFQYIDFRLIVSWLMDTKDLKVWQTIELYIFPHQNALTINYVFLLPLQSSHFFNDSTRLSLLCKFFVRSCSETPRVGYFTFHHDGFYKTLKRRAKSVLEENGGRGPTTQMLMIQGGSVIYCSVNPWKGPFNTPRFMYVINILYCSKSNECVIVT
jgi:hypothetical protein